MSKFNWGHAAFFITVEIVYFERLTKVDPISVLKLLDSLGYATKVTTTSRELEEAVKRERNRGSKLFEE